MSLEYNRELIPRAKELRKNMTKQEKRLWYDFLLTCPVRFQRQKTIGSFIADFYCYQAKLIVEVDGEQHETEKGKTYDAERTALLSKYDLRVIRFSNDDIDYRFEEVCRSIVKALENLL